MQNIINWLFLNKFKQLESEIKRLSSIIDDKPLKDMIKAKRRKAEPENK